MFTFDVKKINLCLLVSMWKDKSMPIGAKSMGLHMGAHYVGLGFMGLGCGPTYAGA